MILKRTLIPFLFLAFMLPGFTATQAATPGTETAIESVEEYVYIYLKNTCSHDVKYEVKYSGHGSSGTVYKSNKQRLTVQPGAKIYIDGELLMEVEDSDDGETFTVCR
jgi:hypothetical protein